MRQEIKLKRHRKILTKNVLSILIKKLSKLERIIFDAAHS